MIVVTYLGVRQRMIHKTNASHDLSSLADTTRTIRRITVDLFTLCRFVARPDASNFAFYFQSEMANGGKILLINTTWG